MDSSGSGRETPALRTGAVVGPYEVTDALGEGGMGEVYRAADSRLGRQVALKVLPGDFAADSERHSRFEREARLLASLNHPNVATLYGIEHLGGTHVLVMELVEGEDLSERIARGPVPLEEALGVAAQIAEALEAAHAAGIVHRDLKPANVKVRPDGTVKVLDFGLAKTWASEAGENGLSLSPTISARHTAAGVILGTAAYMSPEQARGRPVDKRADIWAFGVVLWEMLTGRKLFEGETVSDVLAAILTREPEPSALPESTPPQIRSLLGRCLRRDPRQRLHDVADARIVIEETLRGPAGGEEAGMPAAPRRASRRERLAWVVAAGAVIAAAGIGAWMGRAPRPAALPPALAFVPPPPGTSFRSYGFGAGPVVVSPDGTRLAFSATDEKGQTRIWVRPLRGDKAAALAGTRDGSFPFWSADSRSLGFFADQKLKTVSIGDGTVRTLADAPCLARGGAWGPNGVIAFVPKCGGPIEGIRADGGAPTPLVQPSAGSDGFGSPAFVHGSGAILYTDRAPDGSLSVREAWRSTGRSRLVLRDAYHPQYASGRLLFCRNGTVFAAPFDASAGKVAGEAKALGEAQMFSASDNGVLAFQGGTGNARLEWFDRRGTSIGAIADIEPWVSPKLAPGGRRVLAVVQENRSGTDDLWSYPVDGGVGTRLTFSPGPKGFSVWSPDGRYVAYSRRKDGGWIVCRKRADGSGAEDTLSALGPGVEAASVIDWSPDGAYLSVDERNSTNERWSNWALPLRGGGKPFRPAPVEADQYDGNFSPDGRWLAYFSYETGRPEVFVVPFPATGAKYQISQAGGWAVRWGSGNRLFFLTMGNRLMEADLETAGGSLQVTSIEPLFRLNLPRTNAPLFDVTPDGTRFLVATSADPAAASSISLLMNWPAVVERRQ